MTGSRCVFRKLRTRDFNMSFQLCFPRTGHRQAQVALAALIGQVTAKPSDQRFEDLLPLSAECTCLSHSAFFFDAFKCSL